MTAEQTDDGRGANRFVFILTIILLVSALVVGGSSRNNPLGAMVVELLGLATFVFAALHSRGMRPSAQTTAALALLFLVFAVPVAQLAPVPPDLWQALPGREPLVRAVRLIGLPNSWRPMSLAPDETARAVLYVLGPAGLFLATLQCNHRQRSWLVVAVLGVAVSSLVVGAIQVVAATSGPFQFYKVAAVGLPVGFFANRNHQASFLVGCVALTAALPSMDVLPDRLRRQPLMIFGLMFLFVAGAAATLSRAGILLLVPVIVGAALVLLPQIGTRGRMAALSIFAMASVAAIAGLVILKGGAILERFRGDESEDLRFTALPHVIDLSRGFQPVGSGLGSFDLVYRANERLDQLGPTYLNHVHNDYVELWLEAGWISCVLVGIAFAVWWLISLRKTWSGPPENEKIVARVACLVTAALLLHSLVDYPLRTPALAALFAFACALQCGNLPKNER